jgi:hypothetical protein
MWIEAVTLGTVHTEALQLPFLVDETESVTIGKGRRTRHIERVTPYLLDIPHILPHRLGGVRGKDIRLSAMEEIGGKPTVEGLIEIRCERVGTVSL